MVIRISLNGHPQDVPENLSLGQLLKQLQVNPFQVAVSKNLEVIVRSELEQTYLFEGDEIEIFHAVGGG
jgi:sulfur carrier protein